MAADNSKTHELTCTLAPADGKVMALCQESDKIEPFSDLAVPHSRSIRELVQSTRFQRRLGVPGVRDRTRTDYTRSRPSVENPELPEALSSEYTVGQDNALRAVPTAVARIHFLSSPPPPPHTHTHPLEAWSDVC